MGNKVSRRALQWVIVYPVGLVVGYKQCCGSGMIYSGSRSNFAFSEFRIWIRIQAKAPDPCGPGSGSNTCYLSLFGNCKKTTLNSIIKKNLSTICHFYFILQSSSTQSPELTEKFLISALSYLAGSGLGTIIPDPDPDKSSGSMRIRIHNTGYKGGKKTTLR